MEHSIQQNALDDFDIDIYFKVLVAVANADGIVFDAEKTYLQDQATLMNYQLSPLFNQKINLADINMSNASSLTRKTIIRDCIALAYIDGNYNDEEKRAIIEIGRIVDVTPIEISNIEAWLLEYWNIIDKGNKLLTS